MTRLIFREKIIYDILICAVNISYCLGRYTISIVPFLHDSLKLVVDQYDGYCLFSMRKQSDWSSLFSLLWYDTKKKSKPCPKSDWKRLEHFKCPVPVVTNKLCTPDCKHFHGGLKLGRAQWKNQAIALLSI